MSLLSKLFSGNSSIQSVLAQDPVIVDVRTSQEFAQAHCANARNIPLSSIASKAEYLRKFKRPVVLCCASGMRSGQAVSILRSKGLDCHNGGGWRSLERKLG